MSTIPVPEFKNYQDEANYWDSVDTSPFMQDDGEWFRFEVPEKRAVRVAILPEVIEEILPHAHARGVSVETLVNAWLIEHLHELIQVQ